MFLTFFILLYPIDFSYVKTKSTLNMGGQYTLSSKWRTFELVVGPTFLEKNFGFQILLNPFSSRLTNVISSVSDFQTTLLMLIKIGEVKINPFLSARFFSGERKDIFEINEVLGNIGMKTRFGENIVFDISTSLFLDWSKRMRDTAQFDSLFILKSGGKVRLDMWQTVGKKFDSFTPNLGIGAQTDFTEILIYPTIGASLKIPENDIEIRSQFFVPIIQNSNLSNIALGFFIGTEIPIMKKETITVEKKFYYERITPALPEVKANVIDIETKEKIKDPKISFSKVKDREYKILIEKDGYHKKELSGYLEDKYINLGDVYLEPEKPEIMLSIIPEGGEISIIQNGEKRLILGKDEVKKINLSRGDALIKFRTPLGNDRVIPIKLDYGDKKFVLIFSEYPEKETVHAIFLSKKGSKETFQFEITPHYTKEVVLIEPDEEFLKSLSMQISDLKIRLEKIDEKMAKDVERILSYISEYPTTITPAIKEKPTETEEKLTEEEKKLQEKLGEAAEVKKGKIILKSIIFKFDSWEISDDGKKVLDEVAKYVIGSGKKIFVEGHTDDIGDEKYNLELSKKRAKAVSDYLIKKGVDKGKISWEGYGPKKPLYPNINPENRMKNRRVEIRIIDN